MDYKNVKEQLYNRCIQFVDERINNIQSALDNAKESISGDHKSSAGDKHETGRAMVHIEQEKNTKFLSEALSLKQALSKLNINETNETVTYGSLVITNSAKFFISISAGKLVIDNIEYWAITPISPIAKKISGLNQGDSVKFNGQNLIIKEIY